MVKILNFTADFTEAQNLDVQNLFGLELMLTNPIADQWPKQMRIRLRSKKKPQDYFPVGSLNLTSGLFMEACHDFHVNAEFLPIQLLEKDGSASEKEYCFCHLLDEVDCVDFEKSRYTLRDGHDRWIDELMELVLDEERAKGYHLFLLEISKYIIGVSDEFAEHCQHLGLRGVVFEEPINWNTLR